MKMASGTTKKSSGRRKSISYARFGYFFIIPFFVVYLIFSLTPLFSTFWYSTTNIGDITAEFNGFSNTVVYYDQYLDLNAIYAKKIQDQVGISAKEYSRIKSYFSLQSIVRDYDPFNEEGMNAIAGLTTLSDSTKASVNAYMASKNPSDLTVDALKELAEYRKNFSALDKNIMDQLPTVLGAVNTIKTAAADAAAATTDTATDVKPEEAILPSIQTAIDDLTALKAADVTDENKTAVMAVDYYAAKLNGGKAPANAFDFLIKYYGTFQSGSASVHDYNFYTTSAGLVQFGAIKTDFTADLKTILSTDDWLTTINSLSSVSKLESYSNAESDIHSETLYADLKVLSDAGIIQGEPLVEKDGALAVDTANSLVAQLRTLIDTNYQSDPNEIKAVAHIRNLLIYTDDKSFKAVLDNVDAVKSAGGISSFMNFSADRSVDTALYLSYKDAVGLSDKLSLARYEELDTAKKESVVKAAQDALKKAQAELPKAQAAYDSALAGGDKKVIADANNALAKIKNTIKASNDSIKSPSGIFQKADAKSSFVFVGLDNYKSIFTDNTRFTKVFGDILTTVIMWVMNFAPQILLALLLAAWMTDSRLHLKGLNAMKALIYLPNIMTAATVAIFFYRSFQYSTNPASKSMAQLVLQLFGDEDGFNFFASPWAARSLVAFINFWMWYGNTMIILIAGISSISTSLFESAQIDGASNGQIFRRITIPLIRPIMLYTLITALIGGLQMYDIPKLLQNGEPTIMFLGTKLKSTETILMYIQDQAFGIKSNHFIGVAAAVSVLLFAITSLISAVLFYVMRDKDASRAKKLAKKGGIVR